MLGHSYRTHPPVSREHSIYQSDEVGEGALEGELLDDGVTEDGGGVRGTDVHVSSKRGDGEGGREILKGLDVCETSIHIVLGKYRGVIFLACFKQHVGLVYFCSSEACCHRVLKVQTLLLTSPLYCGGITPEYTGTKQLHKRALKRTERDHLKQK